MEIIAPHLAHRSLSDGEAKVYSRIIHAAGDPDYADRVVLHKRAVAAGVTALRRGASIYCDVEMVRVGINRRRLISYGGELYSLIADEEVIATAEHEGITRSMAAMRRFGRRMEGEVVAIGNAPTALFELLRMMRDTGLRPALIVGVPVGFVGAAESKQMLIEESPVPYITVLGNKGGSSVAVAAVNALLYLDCPKHLR